MWPVTAAEQQAVRSKQTRCLTSTETIRLSRDGGEVGGGGGGGRSGGGKGEGVRRWLSVALRPQKP